MGNDYRYRLIVIEITDIGELPYDFVRPILLKLENPEQLVRRPD